MGRGLFWLARVSIVAAGAVALAPVTLVAAGAFWYGWWRGAPPRRVYLAALWCLPMVVTLLVAGARLAGKAVAASTRTAYPAGAGPGSWWFRAVVAPYR